MSISVVVLTRNEEKNIDDCLRSLSWCDEIIIIDDFSTDQTIKIAEQFNVQIFQKNLNDDFAMQRNFGIEKTKSDWIMFVDADERVGGALAQEIKSIISNKDIDFLLVKRLDNIWGKTLRFGETGSLEIVRIARRNWGKWRRRVHEVWEPNLVQNSDNYKKLDNPLLHFPHQTLREFISDIERYSTIHAEENYLEGKRSNLFKIIFFQKLKFIQNFFLKLGFLDGIEGFVVAMLMSFHSYLAWSKLFVLQSKKNE